MINIDFNKHLRDTNLSYLQHMKRAVGFILSLSTIILVLIVHALFPFMLEHKGSEMIAAINKKML